MIASGQSTCTKKDSREFGGQSEKLLLEKRR